MAIIKLNLRLLLEDGTPLSKGTRVRVIDEDPLQDDDLTTISVGENDEAEALFGLSQSVSGDTPLEARPDVYFVVASGTREGFRSRTLTDLEAVQGNPVTKEANTTHDLGDVTVYETVPVDPAAPQPLTWQG